MRITLGLVFAMAGLSIVPAFAPGGAAGAGDVRVTVANGPANEAWVVANPLDPMNLVAVAKDYTLGALGPCSAHNVWMGVYVSHDGGASWSNSLAPGHPANRIGALDDFVCSSDPVAYFGGDGTLYLTGLAINQPGVGPSALWTAVSHDGGDHIGAVTVSARTPALFDKSTGAVDPVTGIVYNAVVDFSNGGQILFVAGTPTADGSIAWRPPRTIGGAGTDPMISVLPGGLVNVNWMNAIGGNTIFGALGLPLGLVFTPPTTIQAGINGIQAIPNAAYRAFTLPTSAVDRLGQVYITYHALGAQGQSDVFLIRSAPMAQKPWTAPVKVNQDATANSQFMPTVTVSPDGLHVAVAYYDRRDDPANKLVTAYLSVSDDLGATWTDTRVGDALFDGDFGLHQNGFAFIGDYIGAAATADGVHVAWADTRDFAAVATGSEVYADFVPF